MSKKNKKNSTSRFRSNEKFIPVILLAAITAIFTFIIHPDLGVTKHSYNLGDIVEKDIKAPNDFFIGDTEATEIYKLQAMESVLTVYDYDLALEADVIQRVTGAFQDARRRLSESIAEPDKASGSAVKNTPAHKNKKPAPPLDELKPVLKKAFEKTMGIKVSDGAFDILFRGKFPVRIENLINTITRKTLSNGVVTNKDILLFDKTRGIVLRTTGTKAEKVVHNLKSFYGPDQAEAMVRIIGQPVLKGFNYSTINLIVDFSQRLIEPNITLNRQETDKRKEEAAASVKTVMYKIKAGEMLLREGERVTKKKLLTLKGLNVNTKNSDMMTSKTGTAMITMCLLVVWYILSLKKLKGSRSDINKNLMLMACVLITVLFFAKLAEPLSRSMNTGMPFILPEGSVLFGIPVTSGAMVICLFMGYPIAIPFAAILSILIAMLLSNNLTMLIYFLLSCTMSAYWMQACRERKVFIKTGLKIGLLNIILVSAIDVYTSDISLAKLACDWALAFTGGIFAGIITAGTAPLVEVLFDYTTDIKLLELANLDQPILRRLMIEAPGTYNHSVIVGTMAEAAAAKIGVNPLLAMVSGYYHDIGKISKPLYFIENQLSGKNRHDKLAPSMSALIIIGHIKNGVEMAKEHKLGILITNAIRQHHGTSLIKFFYEKARQQKGEGSISINDFRYPGPKPQSKEIAIVMLADVVEAASRTIENPTPSKIQGLVQNLINKIFSDGQLDECDLTLRDLHNIAKSFNTLLNGIYHHRIKYSEAAAPTGKTISPESNNGNSDNQRPKQNRDRDRKDRKQGEDHLKRLGQ